MKYFTYRILFTLLFAFGLSAQAADIDTRVSRNPIAANESFQLILQTEETPDGEPDFSPLTRDFDILDQRQSENIKMINGELSRTIGWTVTLIPRRTGTLEIPEIRFGADRSRAIQLRIEESPQDRQQEEKSEDIILRLTAEPKTPFVKQQVVLTLQVYQGVGLGNTTLSPPRSNDPEIHVRRLGPDRRYEERVNGRQYLVTKRQYFLFPQKPGSLTIDPATFQGEVMAPGAGGIRFSEAPLPGFGANREVRRAQSDRLSLEVISVPEKFPSTAWLPAVDLRLSDNWVDEPPGFRVGEPVTRTLMLSADGLTASQLPPLKFQLPPEFRLYSDKPYLRDSESGEGIRGLRQERITIVPSQAGDFSLPEIAIDWWNTSSGRQETARLPGFRILVLPPVTADAKPPPAGPVGTGMSVAPEQNLSQGGSVSIPIRLPWLLGLLASACVLAGLAWWLKARDKSTLVPRPKPKPKPTVHRKTQDIKGKQLKQACIANDAEAAGKELLVWAALHWSSAPPTTLGTLAGCFAGSDAEREIRSLEHYLYAAKKGDWDGRPLWQAMKDLIIDQGDIIGEQDLISPSYPR